MSYLDVLKTCYKKSFTIEGRASRSEFWLFQLHLPILSIVVIFFFEANAPYALLFLLTIFFWLLLFASIPAYFCLTIRRLHDIGYTGWVILPFLFPIFGWALGLLFCLLPSGKENRYDLESGTYETQNSGNLVKERIGMDKNVNRYNIENNALLLPIAMVFGLILIFAGGFSQNTCILFLIQSIVTFEAR